MNLFFNRKKPVKESFGEILIKKIEDFEKQQIIIIEGNEKFVDGEFTIQNRICSTIYMDSEKFIHADKNLHLVDKTNYGPVILGRKLVVVLNKNYLELG